MTRILMSILLAIATACSDDDIGECEAQPEPFRFKVVDQEGNNMLTGENEPSSMRIFYFEDSREQTIEAEIRGNGAQTYARSVMLPWISSDNDIDTFYLDRDGDVDTISVSVSEQRFGGECNAYFYSDVDFNGIQAEYDSMVKPPVYILVQ